MNFRKNNCSPTILHVVMGMSEHEWKNVRTGLADALQCDPFSVFLVGTDSPSVSDVLPNGQWDMVCFAVGGESTATEQMLRLSKLAKESGALSIIAAKCKSWNAAEALAEYALSQEKILAHADSLILFPDETASEQNFYTQVGEFLSQIKRFMDRDGPIILDFDDISSVLKDAGIAYVANQVIKVDSLENQTHNYNQFVPQSGFATVKNYLLSIVGCTDIELANIEATTSAVRQQLASNADFSFGLLLDPTLKSEMRITVLLSGIDPSIVNIPGENMVWNSKISV